LAKPRKKQVAGFDEEIAVIEANLDDMNRKSTATSWKKLWRGRSRRLHHAGAD